MNKRAPVRPPGFPQRGLSLVELMVALVLGLLITAGTISFYLQSKRNFTQDEQITRMQENARVAMDVLVRDLEMAAYWGGMTDSGSTIQWDPSVLNGTVWNIGADCGTGWAYDPVTALGYLAKANASTAAAAFPCITATELYLVAPTAVTAHTNIVALKHVRGAPTATPAADTVYLRTNGTAGSLYREPPLGALISGADWEHQAHVYYIAKDAADSSLPVLFRKRLRPGTPPAMETEAGGIAEGVEYFRIQFGQDSDGDGVANRYLSAPTAAQMQAAVSARIYLLARSVEPAASYTNTKKYYLGDATALVFNDSYYRRVYTTTVVLRNPANMLRLNQ